MIDKLYVLLARKFTAWVNCIEAGNEEWKEKHREAIVRLVNEYLPSGSGFIGCEFEFTESKPDRLVISFEFLHYTESGYEDRYTAHQLIVTPSLSNGYNMRITGRDYHEIKDYFYDVFRTHLDFELDRYGQIT